MTLANLGIHVKYAPTSLAIPVVADAGIPFAVGTAPVHLAEKPGKPFTPILCTSWDEAVEKLGFSDDWEKYTLCEVMYSHFQLFACQPVIFCNVFDPETTQKQAEAQDYPVTNHVVSLPADTLLDSIVIVSGSDTLTPDEDYTAFSDEKTGTCTVELLETGKSYDATSLQISYATADPSAVQEADIVEGLSCIDDCMTVVGKIPDLILAPGWSSKPSVAAVMAAKADNIMGLFRGMALIDIGSSADGVTEYSALPGYKNKNNLVDESQIVCWPMVKLGERKFHLSTQLAGLMAQIDATNGGVPYQSPSNHSIKADGCCLANGTEINLSWSQVNLIAGDYGIVTAINFLDQGWTAKGNYAACFPGNTDPKDKFFCIKRMFHYISATIIRTFWSKLDRPCDQLLRDTILDSSNLWLSGLVGSGYLHGARAEMLESENPPLDLMAGIIRIHIYLAPPAPMQECDFTLEYDSNYVLEAFS